MKIGEQHENAMGHQTLRARTNLSVFACERGQLLKAVSLSLSLINLLGLASRQRRAQQCHISAKRLESVFYSYLMDNAKLGPRP